MAISRRAILKLGVSYGTGAINFGNDSIVYERELRKLASNPAFGEFESAMEKAAEIAAEIAAPAALEQPQEEQKDIGASGEERNAVAAETTAPTPTATANGSEARNDEEKHLVEEEPPHENPLKETIEVAERFRELCSQLALSSLYLQMTGIIDTMQEECLPAIDDLAKVKQDYDAIIDYLAHC